MEVLNIIIKGGVLVVEFCTLLQLWAAVHDVQIRILVYEIVMSLLISHAVS